MSNPSRPSPPGGSFSGLTNQSLQNLRVHRRSVLAGAGVVGFGGIAAVARLLSGGGDDDPDTNTAAGPAPTTDTQANNSPANPDASTPGPRQAPARITEVADRSDAAPPAAQGNAGDGLALVTSPRLPLFGVGSADRDRILAGEVGDWREVGSAVGLPVEVVAIDGQVPDGASPVETYADYEALVAGLADHPGAVALLPVDQVDFRVNVLSIDNVDPLRDRGDGSPLRVAFVGDIVPGRHVHQSMVEYNDFTHPFLRVADHLSRYDLTIANLEGNLSDNLPQPENIHSFSFVSSPRMIDGFKLAGIDAVTLANNHSTWNDENWGVQGLLDTIDALDAAEMPHFGAGRDLEEARNVHVAEVKGLKVAFLGVDGVTGNQDYPERDEKMGVVGPDWAAGPDSPGTNPYNLEQILADVEAAAGQYDIVIPYLHMGAEYKWLVPDWVVQASHSCIDAGATMVVTNHPHIIQGMEVYNNIPIVYSVGNFVFDQMFSVDTRQGLILEIDLGGKGGKQVLGIRTRGVEIEDFNQPRLMTDAEQAGIMDRFWRSTDWLASR